MVVNQRMVVYTCITGGYDELLEPLVTEPGVDYICVSCTPPQPGSVWRHLPLPPDTGDAVATSRYVKMHPHILFPQHDISIYVDGNIKLLAPVAELASESMRHASIALYGHTFRNCVYEEALECSILGYDWHWRIAAQMKRYRRDGFPTGWGLFEGNVIIRNHHNPDMIRLMKMWWNEYSNGVRRDQLSLTYLAWKTSTTIYNLGPSDPRGVKAIFSLDKIHSGSSLLRRIRRAINWRLIYFGFVKKMN